MICLNGTADPEVRCIKVTTSEPRSPLARGDGARMRDNGAGKAVLSSNPAPRPVDDQA